MRLGPSLGFANQSRGVAPPEANPACVRRDARPAQVTSFGEVYRESLIEMANAVGVGWQPEWPFRSRPVFSLRPRKTPYLWWLRGRDTRSSNERKGRFFAWQSTSNDTKWGKGAKRLLQSPLNGV